MDQPRHVSAQTMMEFRRLTGMGVMDAKHYLESTSEFLCERILEAARNGHYRFALLLDPIEFAPEIIPTLEQADEQTCEELQHVPRQTGFCHLFWRTKKRILRDQFGIEWRTPVEMNPGCHID